MFSVLFQSQLWKMSPRTPDLKSLRLPSVVLWEKGVERVYELFWMERSTENKSCVITQWIPGWNVCFPKMVRQSHVQLRNNLYTTGWKRHLGIDQACGVDASHFKCWVGSKWQQRASPKSSLCEWTWSDIVSEAAERSAVVYINFVGPPSSFHIQHGSSEVPKHMRHHATSG